MFMIVCLGVQPLKVIKHVTFSFHQLIPIVTLLTAYLVGEITELILIMNIAMSV